MKSQLREQALRLRIEGELSYSQIRERLQVAKSTLSYWLQDYHLSEEKILELRRRGWEKGEASRERFRATMRRKRSEEDECVYKQQRKQLLRLSNGGFFAAGLMLYAAEGTKRNGGGLVLANTDPAIIAFFIKWIVEFCGAKKDGLRVHLHLYENMDIKSEENFWHTKLSIPKVQFYKSEVRPLQRSSFSYRESHRHGTCSIYIFGVERKRKVMMSIRALIDAYLEK